MMNTRILSAIFRYLKTRPTFESVGIESYRKLLEKSVEAFKPDKSVRIKSAPIGNLYAQWLIPPDVVDARTILYVHGGGYIAGSVNSHRDLASRIARVSRSKLLLFDYRLAPEHPFPAGLNDVKLAYEWLLKNSNPGDQISVMGDSAGGGLALALMAMILKENLPMPVCLVLISPWIDLECKNPSHQENNEKDPMLSQTVLKKTARMYTNKTLSDPLVSPINNDFKGLCPVLIQVGELEVLIDDSKFLADRLIESNVDVTLEIWKGMFHVWHYFSRYLADGRKAVKAIGQFVETHTSVNGSSG